MTKYYLWTVCGKTLYRCHNILKVKFADFICKFTAQVVMFHSPPSENKHLLPADRKPGEETESLVGKQVEYVTDKGVKRTGLVIYQVPAKPSVYYIKYDDDFHIHVYDLVKTP